MTGVAIALVVAVAAEETKSPPPEYASKLRTAPPTAEAQFRLAEWAKRQGLKDVAEGHLRAAVFLDPHFAQAQRSLGRSLHDGLWETKDERTTRTTATNRLRNEFASWRRRLATASVEAVRGQPLTEAATAALEEYAAADAGRSADAVKALATSDSGAATLELLRLALASPFADVRRGAATSLTERNPDHYLLTLLDYARPQRAGKQMVLGVGEVWYWQEGTTMFSASPEPDAAGPTREPPIANGIRISTLLAPTGRMRPPAEFVQRPQKQAPPLQGLEDAHAVAQNLRSNAVAALQVVTGLKIGDDFGAWREALMQRTGSSIDDRSPAPTSAVGAYYQPESLEVGTRLAPAASMHSCFAAGTPVATRRGMVPIDQVCLGELVLSKNVETGETAYKPVLARTLLPRAPMTKLTVGGESLQATARHPFWTDERGWVKVKGLKAGTVLGIEDGTLALSRMDAGEPAQAYNLVVADFGTYFVGKNRLLVHDNSPIRDASAMAR